MTQSNDGYTTIKTDLSVTDKSVTSASQQPVKSRLPTTIKTPAVPKTKIIESTPVSTAMTTPLDVSSLAADTLIDWQRFDDGSYSSSSYINRDLSLLQFHMRVLAQAASPLHPLLERLFFLIIFSSNLDEFFEIRVAGLMQKLNLGDAPHSPHGMRPSETLSEISLVAHKAIDEQYRILNEDILPALAEQDIRYLKRDELNAKQSAWMKRYFIEQVSPVLTPISIDPAHPFPRLVNKSLNFIASLEGKDAFGRDINLAIVPAPRSLPRVIRLPDE